MENYCQNCAKETICNKNKSKLKSICCNDFAWKPIFLRNEIHQPILKPSEITEMIKAFNELYTHCSSQSLVDDLLIISTKYLSYMSIGTVSHVDYFKIKEEK